MFKALVEHRRNWSTCGKYFVEVSLSNLVLFGGHPSPRKISRALREHKHFCKIILKEKYKDYDQALIKLNLDTLERRRQDLCLRFAKDGIKHNKLNDLFPTNTKEHNMKTRNNKRYKVDFANTERFRKSSIVTMQNMLNDQWWLKEIVAQTIVLANHDSGSLVDFGSKSL